MGFCSKRNDSVVQQCFKTCELCKYSVHTCLYVVVHVILILLSDPLPAVVECLKHFYRSMKILLVLVFCSVIILSYRSAFFSIFHSLILCAQHYVSVAMPQNILLKQENVTFVISSVHKIQRNVFIFSLSQYTLALNSQRSSASALPYRLSCYLKLS